MIGVKFSKAMRPYGRGDVALVTDSLGIALIQNGDAVEYFFPDNPHAVEAGNEKKPAYQASVVDINTNSDPSTIRRRGRPPRQFYLTKDA